jgi:hypothetical protein
MRSVLLLLPLVVACEGRPDRPDPSIFPDAFEETDLTDVLTSCGRDQYPFSVEARGFHPTMFDGVGTVTFDADPDPTTTILLRGCGPGRSEQIGLPFHGVGHLDRGQYTVSRDAVVDGGFLFAYRDLTEFEQTNCSEDPSGTVTISRVDHALVVGRFDVTATCVTADEPNPGEYRKTRFRGNFRAVELEAL